MASGGPQGVQPHRAQFAFGFRFSQDALQGQPTRVWLVTAEPNDASSISDSLRRSSASGRPNGFFSSVHDGSPPIGDRDVLLFRDRGETRMLAGRRISFARDALVRSVAGAIRDSAPPTSAQELLYFRMSGNGHPMKCSILSNSAFSYAIQKIQRAGCRSNPHLAATLSKRLLDGAPSSAHPLVRGLLLRLYADALTELSDSDSGYLDDKLGALHTMYREAESAFWKSGYRNQMRASARGACALSNYSRTFVPQLGLPGFETPSRGRPSRSRLGFRAFRCLGILLKEIDAALPPAVSCPGPLDYLGSIDLPDHLLAACIERSWSDRIVASSTVAPSAEPDSSATIQVLLVDEHLEMMDLVRYGARKVVGDQSFVVSLSCTTGRVEPSSALMTIGNPKTFHLIPARTGRHLVSITLMDEGGATDCSTIDVKIPQVH